MMRTLCFISLLVILFNCGEEESFIAQYQVEEEAKTHVSNFFAEAKARGFSLDTSNLIVRFKRDLNSNIGDPICGNARGSLTNNQQNIINVDPECLAWRHSELSREILIFHELGHTFLERIHQNNLFPNGDYKSIMFGGNWNVLRYYTEDLNKRAYYLNELFDPATTVPDWAK